MAAFSGLVNRAKIDSYRHPDYTGKGWSDVEERFATMVRRIDNCVGDLLQTLDDLGIADNTMVVFTSDNGPHHESYIADVNYEASSFQSYGPFDGTKRDSWEGGIRMPTLAWWPGHIASGSTHQQPSQFHDWMPTFAEVAGVVAPSRTDGVSIAKSLQGKKDDAEGTVYVEYINRSKTSSYPEFLESRKGKKRGEMQVIFVDGFKGIRPNVKSHSDPFEIYDVKTDLGERKNLAGTSEKFEDLQQRMKDRVLRLRVPNETAKRPYDNEPIPGLKEATSSSKEIALSIYEGTFPYVPNVVGMKPTETMNQRGDEPRSFAVARSKPSAIEFRWWLNIKKEGDYQISFSTPTKAFLRIHNAGIIDADFGYKANTNKIATVRLGKGFHPVRVTVLSDDTNATAFEFDQKMKK
jgi:uncharacterized sulfatase